MLTLNGVEPVSSESPVADGGSRCDSCLSLSALLALFTISATALFFNARTSIEEFMSFPNPPKEVKLLNHVIKEAIEATHRTRKQIRRYSVTQILFSTEAKRYLHFV
jgi:hypothetical protein